MFECVLSLYVYMYVSILYMHAILTYSKEDLVCLLLSGIS